MTSPSLRSLAAPTLSDQAYQAIVEALASGELQPGEKVTERGLAERLEVSPTPVREALQRLVQDGRIERTGPRTLRVSELGELSLAEVDEIEIELRVLTARYAARKASATDVARLQRMLDSISEEAELLNGQLDRSEVPDEAAVQRVFEVMRGFHVEIERLADNPVLERVLEQSRVFSVAERRRAAQLMSLESVESVRKRFGDHQLLVDALRAGDEAAAGRIMRQHTESAYPEIHRAL